MNAAETASALALADRWQRGFPLQPKPFSALAAAAGVSEQAVIRAMQLLKQQEILARIGAAVRPNTAGASTLAAMSVPQARLDEVADLVSRHRAVNHNYEREHEINLWFVVTAADRAEVDRTLTEIADASRLKVHDLPLEQAYHIDLGFSLTGQRQRQLDYPPRLSSRSVSDADRSLLQALEAGLALVARPYADLARRTGCSELEVLSRLRSLCGQGVIARFGCILRHRKIGYRANAMAVWDVPDAQVDVLAEKLAGREEVTLCYRRTRRPPSWRYNLFAMIHGRERDAVIGQIAAAGRETGLNGFPSSILFSRRCFKQSAARMAPVMRGAA